MISKRLGLLMILAGSGLLFATLFFLVMGSAALLTVSTGEPLETERILTSDDKGPDPTGTPAAVSTTPAPASTVESKQTMFEWSWPKRISTDDEGTVSFSAITIADEDEYLRTLTVSPHEGTGAERPVERRDLKLPRKPLADAFGPGYTATATATLEAPSFKKSPEGDVSKVLDEEKAEWRWIVTPQGEGNKLMTLLVKVEWVGTDPSLPKKQKEWRKELKTEVKKPLAKVGTFELIPWLTGISGATLLTFGAFIFGKKSKKDEQTT